MSSFMDRAAVIGVVSIYSASEHPHTKIDMGCGNAYSGFVMRNILNARQGESIQFRAHSPLTLSGTYLVFLTDVSDPNADSSSILQGITAKECLNSGIQLTAMVVRDDPSINIGPEAILERRRRPGGDAKSYHKSIHYYFGDLSIAKLLDGVETEFPPGLEPFHVDIEYASYVGRGRIYPAEPLLTALEEMVKPR